jgi:hypothetical protein
MAPKKVLSPTSRAKADKRNTRDKATRAVKAAASGGTSNRAVFGWGGQRHKATNRQAEQASPRNPAINLA